MAAARIPGYSQEKPGVAHANPDTASTGTRPNKICPPRFFQISSDKFALK